MRRLAFPADDSYTVLANTIYDLLSVKSNLDDVPILISTDSLLAICGFDRFIVVLVVSCVSFLYIMCTLYDFIINN